MLSEEQISKISTFIETYRKDGPEAAGKLLLQGNRQRATYTAHSLRLLLPDLSLYIDRRHKEKVDEGKVKELWDQGKTYKEIARELNESPRHIIYLARYHGWKRFSRKRTSKKSFEEDKIL